MRFKEFYLKEYKEITTIEDSDDVERCDGVSYRLSGKKEIIVPIGEVSFTPGNTFYKNRVDEYVEYIKAGGIIDTFPVKKHRLANNFYDMCKFLYDNYGDEDNTYFKKANEDIWYNKFLSNIEPDLTDIFDKKSEYYVDGLNKQATTIKELFLDKTKAVHLDDFELIFDFFDDTFDYTLTEMNHRFKAVKELECDFVYVDVQN